MQQRSADHHALVGQSNIGNHKKRVDAVNQNRAREKAFLTLNDEINGNGMPSSSRALNMAQRIAMGQHLSIGNKNQQSHNYNYTLKESSQKIDHTLKRPSLDTEQSHVHKKPNTSQQAADQNSQQRHRVPSGSMPPNLDKAHPNAVPTSRHITNHRQGEISNSSAHPHTMERIPVSRPSGSNSFASNGALNTIPSRSRSLLKNQVPQSNANRYPAPSHGSQRSTSNTQQYTDHSPTGTQNQQRTRSNNQHSPLASSSSPGSNHSQSMQQSRQVYHNPSSGNQSASQLNYNNIPSQYQYHIQQQHHLNSPVRHNQSIRPQNMHNS